MTYDSVLFPTLYTMQRSKLSCNTIQKIFVSSVIKHNEFPKL